jgi:hypothetical protein
LVGFVGFREGKGASRWKGSRLIVDLALVARSAVKNKVLTHLWPPEEASGLGVTLICREVAEAFMDCL